MIIEGFLLGFYLEQTTNSKAFNDLGDITHGTFLLGFQGFKLSGKVADTLFYKPTKSAPPRGFVVLKSFIQQHHKPKPSKRKRIRGLY
jgi:hypothetical protein